MLTNLPFLSLAIIKNTTAAIDHAHTMWPKNSEKCSSNGWFQGAGTCLLYTSDAADEEDSVELGGRRVIKKKNNRKKKTEKNNHIQQLR